MGTFMNKTFEDNGYLIARNFFSKEAVEIMSAYFSLKYNVLNYNRAERQQIQTTIDKGDVANSLGYYGDGLTESIMLIYGNDFSKLLDEEVVPTYTYTRIYEKGALLLPHTDRPACEISATCPILISDDKPSTIYVSNYRSDSVQYDNLEDVKNRGNYTKVDLFPGDILIYSGTDRIHWREPLESDFLIQFFMHFVREKGPHRDEIYDRRPFIGFDSKYKHN